MAFIRTKRIKEAEYAYIVENKWKKKGAKQKSKKYLGRVYRLERKNMMDFYEHFEINDVEKYLNEREKNDILLDLIRLELFNHGFEEEDGVWVNGEVNFDEKSWKVENSKGRNVALAFNEGFLTTHAVRRLKNFAASFEEEGYDFAKMFIEAGIAVPKDIFVEIFKRILDTSGY